MKSIIITCILLIFSSNLFAQSFNEVDSLINEKERLIVEREELSRSIKLIENQIIILKAKLLKPKESELICETRTTSNAKIKKEPIYNGGLLGEVMKRKTVKVYDYEDGYWLVSNGELTGYTSELYLNIQPEMEEYLKTISAQEEMELEKSKNRAEQHLAEQEVKINKSIDKYGEDIARRIRAHSIWVGMTERMARLSIGSPNEINRSVGSWGVHEQWVYDNKYLYFENGKLTSWQD